MNKLATALMTLLVLLILTYGAYDLYQNYEYKEKIIHTGFKGEARKNPYYASRLFLKRMGIPTETKNSLQGLSGFPDTDTLIIISTNRSTLSPQRTNDLIDWVKSGGHLIALATRDWKYSGSNKDRFDIEVNEEDDSAISPDPLQRFMGIRTESSYSFFKDGDNDDNDNKEEEDNEGNKEIPSIKLNNIDKQLKLDDSSYRPIIVNEDYKSQTEEIELSLPKNSNGNYIIRQKIGNGLVTLLADMDFIKNDEIEYEDHAEILWQLVHGLHKPINLPARVWLIHNDKMAPLWDIMWRNFWALILSLTLLLLFWLVKSIQRFGPMIPKQEEDRRSLIEHINSSGHFYWKNNKKQALIDSSRKALMQRLSRVHPGWTQRTKEEQVKLLAEQFDMKTDSIHRLLFALDIEQPDEFTQLIKQLEELRKGI